MKLFSTFAALLLTASLLFAVGCGQSDDGTPAAPDAPDTPAVEELEDAAPTTQPTTQPSASAGDIVNEKCPVSGHGFDKAEAVTVNYEGKTYGVCCKQCITAFKADPKKFIDKM